MFNLHTSHATFSLAEYLPVAVVSSSTSALADLLTFLLPLSFPRLALAASATSMRTAHLDRL